MKTTNNVQKAENKKLRNVMHKTFILLFSCILISSSVWAQEVWKPLPGKKTVTKMTKLMVHHEGDNEALFALASNSFVSYPTKATVTAPIMKIQSDTEKSLEIESWMTETKYFGQTLQCIDEMEQPLRVEKWMTNEPNFSSSQSAIVDASEENLKIESWMTDENFWGKR